MRQFISLLTLAVIFTTGLTMAAETQPENAENPLNFKNQLQNRIQLNDAIRQRQIRYLLDLQDSEQEDLYMQEAKHNYSLYSRGMNRRSTFLQRDGELESASYGERRPYSNLNLNAPNTQKRNFRVRAIDYFVEGGDAGKEALSENVIYGSTHKANRSFWGNLTEGRQNYADIISTLRKQQREAGAKESTATQYLPSTYRRGDSTRNYLHPYMGSFE